MCLESEQKLLGSCVCCDSEILVAVGCVGACSVKGFLPPSSLLGQPSLLGSPLTLRTFFTNQMSQRCHSFSRLPAALAPASTAVGVTEGILALPEFALVLYYPLSLSRADPS